MGTQLLLPKMAAQPHHFSVHVHCGPTAGWIKTALGMKVGLSPGHIVLDGHRSPLPIGAELHSPIFGPFLLWPNGWIHHDATRYAGWPQPRRLCVRWGPGRLPKKGAEPPLFAHVYCGQTAGCIKMPLGTEVGLSPHDFVLDGNPAPLQKGGRASSFWPISIVVKRLDASRCDLAQQYKYNTKPICNAPISPSKKPDMEARCGGIGINLCDFAVDGDPAPIPKRGRIPPILAVHVYCG